MLKTSSWYYDQHLVHTDCTLVDHWTSDRKTCYYRFYGYTAAITSWRRAIRKTGYERSGICDAERMLGNGFDPVAFMETFNKVPIIEQFAKAGCRNLVEMTIRMPSSAAKIQKMSRNRIRIIMRNDLSQREIEQLGKVPESDLNPDVDLIRLMAEANYTEDYMSAKKEKRALRYIAERNSDVFEGRNISWTDYADYIRMMKQMGDDEKKRKFPDYFWSAHDDLMKRYRRYIIVRNEQEIEKLAHHLQTYQFEDSRMGLIIRPCRSANEMISEGKKMHHCVGTYVERVARQETSIFLIRSVESPDDPLATLELRDDVVLQCRAKYNAVPDKKIQEFVEEWGQKFGFRICIGG